MIKKLIRELKQIDNIDVIKIDPQTLLVTFNQQNLVQLFVTKNHVTAIDTSVDQTKNELLSPQDWAEELDCYKKISDYVVRYG